MNNKEQTKFIKDKILCLLTSFNSICEQKQKELLDILTYLDNINLDDIYVQKLKRINELEEKIEDLNEQIDSTTEILYDLKTDKKYLNERLKEIQDSKEKLDNYPKLLEEIEKLKEENKKLSEK